jgi:hypothetical protein
LSVLDVVGGLEDLSGGWVHCDGRKRDVRKKERVEERDGWDQDVNGMRGGLWKEGGIQCREPSNCGNATCLPFGPPLDLDP